ncbi:MAG: glycosyltransferase family 2 protein [Gammaproteobacteria bacterium]|nr:glycosyltransferase family 2 protein [Gammaproteobacteria bacterium]
MDVSVVLPVFNEEDNLQPLHAELSAALRGLKRRYEIIFVDDGSSDRSLDVLQELLKKDAHLRIIEFRRNFGQTAALAAGFDHARGDIVITLDADRQNDPKDIPTLIAKLEEGYDLVNGWRFSRKDPFLSRKLPSRIANWIISAATDVKLHDYGCTLKAFTKEVAKNISLYGEMHRFIPAIASWMGVRIAEVKVNHRPRVSGTSKYGISRTLRVVLDLMTVKFLLSYSARPLQFFGMIGLLSGSLGILLSIWMTIQRLFFDIALADRPLLLLAVLLIFIGLQFITFGLLGELQTRIYYEAQDKPVYAVRQVFERSAAKRAPVKRAVSKAKKTTRS